MTKIRLRLGMLVTASPGAVFTNIPILVRVLTLVISHLNDRPNFISITVSTILAPKSSCKSNIVSNY